MLFLVIVVVVRVVGSNRRPSDRPVRHFARNQSYERESSYLRQIGLRAGPYCVDAFGTVSG